MRIDRSITKPVLILLAVTVVVLGASAVFLAWERGGELAHGRHSSQVQAQLLAEHAAGALRQTEFALREVATGSAVSGAAVIPGDVCSALRRSAMVLPGIANAAFVTPEGGLVCAFSSESPPSVDPESITRLHRDALVDIHVDGTEADSGIAMSLRLDDEEGLYAGAALFVISADYFASRYQEYGTIDVDLIALYDPDGRVMARWSDQAEPIEESAAIDQIPLLRRIPAERLLTTGLSTIETPLATASVFQLPDYPYRMVVAYERRSLLSDWRKMLGRMALTVSVLLVLLYGGGLRIRAAGLARALAQKALEESRNREVQERLRRFEGLRALSGGLAHDINNLMMIVLGNTELLAGESGLSGADQALESIREAAKRSAQLSERMLAVAGNSVLQRRPVDLAVVLSESADRIGNQLPPNVRLELVPPTGPLEADVDPELIEAALGNMANNAAESLAPNGGIIRVHLDQITWTGTHQRDAMLSDRLSPRLYASLTVEDDGSGISPDTLARVFDPFFTTRFLGRGLGLAVVAGIARQHGGAALVHSELGVGTSVSLLLPSA